MPSIRRFIPVLRSFGFDGLALDEMSGLDELCDGTFGPSCVIDGAWPCLDDADGGGTTLWCWGLMSPLRLET